VYSDKVENMSGEGRLVVVRGIFFEKAVLTISVDCSV